MWHDLFTWFLAGVPPLAIIGWVVYWWRGVSRRRAIHKTRVAYFLGLPDKCKSVLMEFVRYGHKVALPPYNPFVEILTKDGVIHKHSSAGTYDAASYYFTIDLELLNFLVAFTQQPLAGKMEDATTQTRLMPEATAQKKFSCPACGAAAEWNQTEKDSGMKDRGIKNSFRTNPLAVHSPAFIPLTNIPLSTSHVRSHSPKEILLPGGGMESGRTRQGNERQRNEEQDSSRNNSLAVHSFAFIPFL